MAVLSPAVHNSKVKEDVGSLRVQPLGPIAYNHRLIINTVLRDFRDSQQKNKNFQGHTRIDNESQICSYMLLLFKA
jgi:hypothetical protein